MAIPDIHSLIAKKKIIIFGAGKEAKEFVKKYSDKIKINYFTSNDETEKDFDNLTRINISELPIMKGGYIIICASALGVAHIESQLSLCFQPWEDFVDSNIFEQAFQGKKKLIVVEGLCHQELVVKGLTLTPEINNDYIVKFYWKALLKSNASLRQQRNLLYRYADFVIQLQLRSEEVAASLVNVPIIKMPLTYMQFLYPQIICAQEMGITYLCNPYKMKLKKKLGDIRAFRYTDTNIVRMLRQGLSEDDVLYEISKLDFYDDRYLEKIMTSSIRTNTINDEMADIHLNTFIMQNFKERKLFLDGQHWSNVLAWEAIRQILYLMGLGNIKIPDLNLIEELTKEDAVWANEIPIYPSVIKLMGLKWAENDSVYTMVKLNEIKKVTFHDYMKEYIRYVNYSLKVQEVW